jgi:hypothetical protein
MAVKALQDILDRIESWPAERQERAAELLVFVETDDACQLTDRQAAEVERRLELLDGPTLTLEEVYARRPR